LTLIGSITSNQSLSLPQLLAFVAPVSSLPSVPIQLIIGWQGRARIRVFFLSQTVPQPLDHFCCDREYISLVNGTSFLPVLLCLTLPYLLHTPPRPTTEKHRGTRIHAIHLQRAIVWGRGQRRRPRLVWQTLPLLLEKPPAFHLLFVVGESGTSIESVLPGIGGNVSIYRAKKCGHIR